MLDDEANGINAFSVLLYTFSRGRVNMGHQNASPFQNHSARVAFSVRKFEHVSPLLEELQWESVDRRVCERDIAMVHELLNNLYAPQCLRNCISYRADVSARDTRAAATWQLQLPRVRTELAKRFFGFIALSLRNEAPANVREAKNSTAARQKAEGWLIVRNDA